MVVVAELALAVPDDLRTHLQDSTLPDGVLQLAIDRASALVRGVARQRFTFVEGETVELVGSGHELTLPERPVVVDDAHPLTVLEVASTGVLTPAVEGIAWYRRDDKIIKAWYSQWNPAMQFRWAGFYGPVRPVGVWGPRVLVTYSHGLRSNVDVSTLTMLKSIVLSAATKFVVNPQGLRSEQVGGITVTWAGESIRAPRDIVDQIREELSAIQVRRGGAFSVTPA